MEQTSIFPPEVTGEQVMTIVCLFGICAPSSALLESFFGHRTIFNGKIRLPLSVVLFGYGILMDYVLRTFNFGIFSMAIKHAESMHPNIIFSILLPICLYESSSQLNYHIFKRNLISSVLLALPGVVVSMILTTFFMYYFVGGIFDWTCSLLISSILSATDPVAVIASLHQLNAPDKLASLVDGESLLNDGAAVVFFQLCKNILLNRIMEPSLILTSGWIFIRCALGGPILGFLFGWGVYLFLKVAQPTNDVQALIAISIVYTLFFLSELIHSSGVLAVVSYGVFMSSRKAALFKPKAQEIHNTIIHFIGKLGNHMIFLLAGIVSARLFRPYIENTNMLLNLFLLFTALCVIRGIMVFVLSPLLTRIGYGLTIKEAIILIWGGLRGGVSLALAMSLESEDYIDSELKGQIAFYVAGTVLLTLLINGTTVEFIYKKLQLYTTPKFHRMFFKKVMKSINEEYRLVVNDQIRKHWFFNAHPGLLELCDTFIPNVIDAKMTETGEIILSSQLSQHTFIKNIKSVSIQLVMQDPTSPIDYDSNKYLNQRTLSCLTKDDEFEDRFIKELDINNNQFESNSYKTSSNNFLGAKTEDNQTILLINSIPISNYTNNDSSSISTLKRESLISDTSKSKIGRHVYIGQMVLSTVWQSYDLLFKNHVISGAALVILKKAISKVFYSCEELNLPIHFAFSSEWDSIRNQLWICKENLLTDGKALTLSSELLNEYNQKNISSTLCLPSFINYYRNKAKSKNLFLDIEVLFSFITARVDLLEHDFHELQSYLGSSSIQLFQNQIIEAQQYLDLLLCYSQEQYNVAISHISVNMLFNALRDSMKVLVKSRLLLEEDEEKLLALCEDRRFIFSFSLSREVINEYTPEN
ncbi:Na+ H+ and K+ H+ antiporter [Cryptosporidium ubiquitum]|uniref:Na+ H+ and K+ H+ antiporter n=1 Tax=Cryptosporidium ubiquitum TaxID=857276 RepID=A0A1J4MFA0_9CRYT|nr:Na+ H+ and K+ H+ antiporter [Cryptosporidium ubiquitum]OII72912.1 Na+ H+ and K+ H+ antiporter [Cryptosporidium ubiquitum]